MPVLHHATDRGYSLLEVVVALAVFGMVLMIIVVLTADMRSWEKRLPVNFMTHPQVSALIARMRRDVLDATDGPMYPDQYPPPPAEAIYKNSDKTLIIYTLPEEGTPVTVVWDFSKPGEVHRTAYNVGNVSKDWVAYAVPDFTYEATEKESGHRYGVRIRAKDSKGRLAIDQVFEPRRHD